MPHWYYALCVEIMDLYVYNDNVTGCYVSGEHVDGTDGIFAIQVFSVHVPYAIQRLQLLQTEMNVWLLILALCTSSHSHVAISWIHFDMCSRSQVPYITIKFIADVEPRTYNVHLVSSDQ